MSEQLDGLLYITTGYSNLDFVLTARITSYHPFNAVWHDLAFGGRGSGPASSAPDTASPSRREPSGWMLRIVRTPRSIASRVTVNIYPR
jgi:hypothetical protein